MLLSYEYMTNKVYEFVLLQTCMLVHGGSNSIAADSSMSIAHSLFSPLSLLSSCRSATEIKQIHAHSVKTGFFLHNPTVPAKIAQSLCQSLHTCSPRSDDVLYTLSVFDWTVEPPSSFLYNTLIRAHTQIDRPEEALLIFYQMLCDPFHVGADKFTFPSVLKSCAQLFAIDEGEQVHGVVLKTQFASDIFVQNSLIHMYSRCRKIDSARSVFDKMSDRNVVSWNSIIDGFAKAGDVVSARAYFDKMPHRNIVSWNSMIAGYVRNGLCDEALDLFFELQTSGLDPDELTMVGIVTAISHIGLLGFGRRVHGYLIRHAFSLQGVLGAALIDMYSKCGSILSASRIFERISNKDVGHWTTMIVGFAIQGYAEASLQLFSLMQASGVKPNHVTFIGVLIACSHRGLVDEGLNNFRLMTRSSDISPMIQHYGCLVDLLGRAGYLEEALAVVENLPMKPGFVIWATLLAACKNHGDIKIAEIASQKLIELAPNYGGGYALLSNIYAGFGRWHDFSRMRRMLEEREVEKVPGFSWIEVDGEVHEFVVDDRFHPKCKEIYSMLDELDSKLRWKVSESALERNLLHDLTSAEELNIGYC
ncbi:hypothetical protein ACLOJK_004869 [Asimina triloba]